MEKIPFHHLDDDLVTLAAARKSEMPQRPETTPVGQALCDALWTLATECCNKLPDLRPTANDIVNRIERLQVVHTDPSAQPSKQGVQPPQPVPITIPPQPSLVPPQPPSQLAPNPQPLINPPHPVTPSHPIQNPPKSTPSPQPIIQPTAAQVWGRAATFDHVNNSQRDPRAVAFSPDGSKLMTGFPDGRVRIWDSTTDRLLPPELPPHFTTIREVAFSSDGERISVCTAGGVIMFYDANVGRLLNAIETKIVTKCASYSHDWSKIFIVDDGSYLKIHTITGEGNRLIPNPFESTKQILHIAASPTNSHLAVCGKYDSVEVFDTDTNKSLFGPLGQSGRFLAFSANGAKFASSSGTSVAWVWDAITGSKLLEIQLDHIGQHVALSFDGSGLVVSTSRGIQLLDAKTGDHLREWATAESVRLVVSPEGTKIVSASRVNGIDIWKVVPTTK